MMHINKNDKISSFVSKHKKNMCLLFKQNRCKKFFVFFALLLVRHFPSHFLNERSKFGVFYMKKSQTTGRPWGVVGEEPCFSIVCLTESFSSYLTYTCWEKRCLQVGIMRELIDNLKLDHGKIALFALHTHTNTHLRLLYHKDCICSSCQMHKSFEYVFEIQILKGVILKITNQIF